MTKKKTAMKVKKMSQQAKHLKGWVDSQCKAMGKEYSNLLPFDKAMCEQYLIDIWGESWGAYWNSEYWKEGSHEGHE